MLISVMSGEYSDANKIDYCKNKMLISVMSGEYSDANKINYCKNKMLISVMSGEYSDANQICSIFGYVFLWFLTSIMV